MASQALSYPADHALYQRTNGDATTYAFIQDRNSGSSSSEGLGLQDLMVQQADDQQSSGWNSSSHMPLFSSSQFSHTGQSLPFGNHMDPSAIHSAPSTQQDLFYQPQGGSSSSTMDYTFLNRRPSSSCSQAIRPFSYYPQTPTSSEMAETMTPQGTPLRRSQSDTPSRSESTTTPGPPAMRATFSQQRRRKVTSSANRMQTSRATSVSSTSTATSSRMAAMFVNTKRLPLRLPRPPICMISDPYADLGAHLRRHGLTIEADAFDGTDMTVDFALRGWIAQSAGGAERLLNETNVFLSQHAKAVQSQLATTGLPAHLDVAVADLDNLADDHGLTPTHFLAVHGIDASLGDDAKGLLLPCHALMYVLQCVSLPFFSTSSGPVQDETKRRIPVVSFRVPRPTEFPTLHRYLYTHDASALLVDLLPMKHIARHWDVAKSKQFDTTPSYTAHLSNQPPAPVPAPTVPSSAANALAHLPTQSLFGYAYKIHSAWANGVAIGLLKSDYWSTLDRAWSLVMAALSIKKARILDTEMRGVQLSLPRTTT
jgi:hypothetical protein